MEKDFVKEICDLLDIEPQPEGEEPPPGLMMRSDALWPGYRRMVQP